MPNSSTIRTIAFVFVLFLTLAGLTGAVAVTAQGGPTDPPEVIFATAQVDDDISKPPLVGGAPAGFKPVDTAPRTGIVPGTLFQSAPNAPIINVWYGANQTFGQNGEPQKWINIVGNVSGASELSYELNGGPARNLSIGPNGNRLINNGDFNIDIAYTDLQPGANTVAISASGNGVTEVNVTVDYQAATGSWAPKTYAIDWSQATKVNDVAQVVDGKWSVSGNTVRPSSLTDTGFDRLIAIGDMSWRDYTVTIPVTVHSLQQNRSPGVGLIVRWTGHYDNGAGFQPVVGWRHLGAMAWYRYEKATSTEGLQLLGDGGQTIGTKPFNLEIGTPYLFKVSITSDPDPAKTATYFFKVWKAADQEPVDWDLSGKGFSVDPDGEPRRGSVLLVAHHADVTFGNVTVDLVSSEHTVNTIAQGTGSVTKFPDKPLYAFGEEVTLTAVPENGKIFTGWSGDATGTENPLTISVSRNMTVVANFGTKQDYTVAATANGNGTVTKSPDKASYEAGEQVILTATPNNGYTFTGWSGDATGTVNPLTITVNKNTAIVANFAAVPAYTLTITVSGNGTVSRSPDKATYSPGEIVQLMPVPASGYVFAGWGGDLSGSNVPGELAMVKNSTVTATFTRNTEYKIFLPAAIR